MFQNRCKPGSLQSQGKIEVKALNGKVMGYHFDVDAAVAKLKQKQSLLQDKYFDDGQKTTRLVNTQQTFKMIPKTLEC